MGKKAAISQEDLDRFEQFLFEMDDVLEPFVEAAEKAGFQLDYSLDSLLALEGYYIARHGQEDEELLINRCARYLGEVARTALGGTWRLSSHPQGLYFKLPVITDYSDKNLEYCPIALFRTFSRRRNLGFLRHTLDGHLPWVRKPKT